MKYKKAISEFTFGNNYFAVFCIKSREADQNEILERMTKKKSTNKWECYNFSKKKNIFLFCFGFSS